MRFMTYVSVDDRRPLESITKLCRESFRIEKALTELVLVARQQGRTWTEIGGALGALVGGLMSRTYSTVRTLLEGEGVLLGARAS